MNEGAGAWHGDRLLGASAATGGTNLQYAKHVIIPFRTTITGIAYYTGGTSNGNVRSGLLSAGNAIVASRTSNSAQPGTNQIHKVAFDAAYTADPGYYFMVLIFSSATATFRAAGSGALVPGERKTAAGFAIETGTTLAEGWGQAPDMTTY